MSTTPRTDLQVLLRLFGDQDAVHAAFARELEEELNDLARWKREMLTVESWWKEIDSFIRKHPEAKLGQSVSAIALEWLKERDELKRENERLSDRVDSLHQQLQTATGDALTWQYWRHRARAAEALLP